MLYVLFIGLLFFIFVGYKLFNYKNQYIEVKDLPDPTQETPYDHLTTRLNGEGKTADAFVGVELTKYQDLTDVKYLHANVDRLFIALQSGRRYRLSWLDISRFYYLQERKSPFFHLAVTTSMGERFVCKNLTRLEVVAFMQDVEICLTQVKSKVNHSLSIKNIDFVRKNCQFKAERAPEYYQELIALKTKLHADLANKKVPDDFLLTNSNTSISEINYKPHLKSN
ncbi:hypothetical protein CKF54_07525 [Psittacicella hinzii]|uniref:Uncharacterized protein n=1 Tax=Psittacicella hinzii TaxID=2028575 RepID=A0A3A1Y104_9GAMM|nr:hypothetical protein [Psittacicella hinzii]RIY31120.1 hypothetical protein CKF54_07525 [Psittacicella hinzii]